MPEEFQILRCYDCEKFQVHHVKKAKKWQCKVCGAKQSLKRAFFVGSSRDCRLNVQQLNFQDGEQKVNKMLGESNSYPDTPCKDDLPSEFFNPEDLEYFDDADWFDKNPQQPSKNMVAGTSQNAADHDLPRKKQRCELHSKYVEKETSLRLPLHSSENESLSEKEIFQISSASKCMEDGNLEGLFNSASNTLKCVLLNDREKESNPSVDKKNISIADPEKPEPRSIFTPNKGFQFILNEARKKRTEFSYDIDW